MTEDRPLPGALRPAVYPRGDQGCRVSDYRIDDLARAAGTTVRNVRAYQERGLLPPPERRGRVAVYGDVHLARLRLVGRLLDRGMTLATIGELVAWWESGHSIDAVLGLEQALVAPWSEDTSEETTLADIEALFDGQVGPDTVERAVALGILAVAEDGRVEVHEPRLLRIAADLVAEGVPLDAVLDAGLDLQARTDAIASMFVALVVDHLITPVLAQGADRIRDEHAENAARLVNRLRPLARMAVDAALVRSLDGEIASALTLILGQLGDQVRPAFDRELADEA